MSAGHRRQRLPEADGTFAGIALATANLVGLAGLLYAAESTAAPAVPELPVVESPDLPPEDDGPSSPSS